MNRADKIVTITVTLNDIAAVGALSTVYGSASTLFKFRKVFTTVVKPNAATIFVAGKIILRQNCFVWAIRYISTAGGYILDKLGFVEMYFYLKYKIKTITKIQCGMKSKVDKAYVTKITASAYIKKKNKGIGR